MLWNAHIYYIEWSFLGRCSVCTWLGQEVKAAGSTDWQQATRVPEGSCSIALRCLESLGSFHARGGGVAQETAQSWSVRGPTPPSTGPISGARSRCLWAGCHGNRSAHSGIHGHSSAGLWPAQQDAPVTQQNTLTQRRANAGPTSTTLARYWHGVGMGVLSAVRATGCITPRRCGIHNNCQAEPWYMCRL